MIICKSFSSECDMCDATGPHPLGGACLAQGATLRWCEVMWICPACVEKQGGLTSVREALSFIHERNDGGYADFDYDLSEATPQGAEH